MLNAMDLLNDVNEAIGWTENEYGFVTDTLKNCKKFIEQSNDWEIMELAPTDGTIVELYVETKEDLPAFVTLGAYHPDAGWCVDELREPIAWRKHVAPIWAMPKE